MGQWISENLRFDAFFLCLECTDCKQKRGSLIRNWNCFVPASLKIFYLKDILTDECSLNMTTLPNGSKWTIGEAATEEPKDGEYHWEIIWRDFKLHIQSLDIKLSAPIWRQLYGSLMSQEGWHCQQNHDRSIKLIHFWWSANWRRRGGNEERRRRIVEHP